MRETARMNLHDQSEYYNQSNNSSVLKRSNGTKFKQLSKTPSKNIILFDSKQESPKKITFEKVHEDYEIKYNDTKIRNLTDKIS